MVREASGSGTLGSKFGGDGSLSGDADGDGSLSSGSLDGSGGTSGQLSGDSVGSLSGVSNEFLVFDSSGNIVTSGYTSGDFAPATHVHPASDITSGTFDDARISESSVLQYESAINHDNLLNVGSNSHGQIDSHIGDNSIHFTESSIDHNNIQNIGSNSHDDIDSHISDGTIHYTKGLIGLSEIGENISSPSDREVVIYNGGDSAFENRLLVEADIPSLSAGKITTGTFNDARIAQSNIFQFVDDTASNLNTLLTSSEIDSRINSNIGSADLGDLDNVTETDSASGEFIRYDGSDWVNTLLSASDIPNLDASKIATGQFADGRISESSVTQHQGALSIGLTQLTQGGASDGEVLKWNDSESEWQPGTDNNDNFYLTDLSFDDANGDLTATVNGATNQTANLDGRYSLQGHDHDGRYYTETEIDDFFAGDTSITGYNKSDWDTAYAERGSQIAGTNLSWDGTQLNATDTNTQLNVGAENQIPFVNSSGNDLEYSSSLRWDDTSLLVGGNVDVSNKIILAPISNPTYAEGQLWYSADTTTLNFQNDRSGVTLNLGEENWLRVRNISGSDISDGEAVYISGFDTGSGLPTIELAQANSENTADLVGLTTETITDNGSGMVATYGLVRGIDTSAYSAGDSLFLSPNTPGALTTTEPSSPDFSVRVGRVSRSHSSAGQILVGTTDIREAIYTQGSIPYADSDGRLIEDNTNLSWDGTDVNVGGNAVWHEGDFTSSDISNWNTAYSERGSQIDGTLLNWNGTQLDVQESSIDHDNLTNYNSDEHFTKASIELTEIGEGIDTPSNRHVVIYDGANNEFENRLLVEADIPNLSAGKITSGTFADSRISESSVTQHQSSLSIDWGQLNNVPTYDNYQSWNLLTNGTQRTTIQSGDDFDLNAGTNVSLSYSAGGVVTVDATDTNTQLSKEEVQDFAWDVLGGTQTLIDVTYDDSNDNVDFVVNDDLSQYDNSTSGFFNQSSDVSHNNTSGYVANEHIDWTSDQGSTNINEDNITQSSVTQHESALTITESQITDANFSNWNTAYDDSVTGVSGSGNGTLTVERRNSADLTADLSHTHTWSELSDVTAALSDINSINQELSTTSNVNFNDGTFDGNVSIAGDLTVTGDKFKTYTETVEIGDNLGIINFGETGAGVTEGFAGWEADRGTNDPYRWGFEESSGYWKLGQYYTDLTYSNLSGTFNLHEEIVGDSSGAKAYIVSDSSNVLRLKGKTGSFTDTETITGQDSGATADVDSTSSIDELQAVATRRDSPNNNALAFWNDTDMLFETDSNLTYDGTDLSIGGNIAWNDGNVSTGSNIDITGRTISLTGTIPRGNLPSSIAYTDEANTFSQDQTVNATINVDQISYSGGGDRRLIYDKDQDGSPLFIQRASSAPETALTIRHDGSDFQIGVNKNTSPSYPLDIDGTANATQLNYNGQDTDNRYAAISHVSDTSNPHSVTKSQVGLENVPNEDATDPSNWDYGLTGIDTNVVTGTAGTDGNIVEWDSNGDAIDSGVATSDVLTSIPSSYTQDNVSETITSAWDFDADINFTGGQIVFPDPTSSPYVEELITIGDRFRIRAESQNNETRFNLNADNEDFSKFSGDGLLINDRASTPPTPGTDQLELYNDGGTLHVIDDGGNTNEVFTQSSQVNHDDTTGFVSNEHIDHSSVSITGGTGLSGGGNLTSSRTLSVDINSATSLGSSVVGSDEILVSDVSDSDTIKKTTAQDIADLASTNVDWGDIGGTLSDQTDLQNALDAKVEEAAGSDGQIQYNDSNNFGASDNLYYNSTDFLFGVNIVDPTDPENLHSTIHSGGSMAMGWTGSEEIVQDGGEDPDYIELDETIGSVFVGAHGRSQLDIYLPDASLVQGRFYLISVYDFQNASIVFKTPNGGTINGGSQLDLTTVSEFRSYKVFVLTAGLTSGGSGEWAI